MSNYKPLSAEEELCLIKNIQSNHSSATAAFSNLFNAYRPFIRSVSWKYVSKNKSWAEDLIQEAEIALFDAVMTFNSTLGFSFEAYVARVVLSKVFNFLRGQIKQPTVTHTIDSEAIPYTYNVTGENGIMARLHYSEGENLATTMPAQLDMDYFLSEKTLKTCSCSEREVEVVRYHFVEGLKKSEIAINLKISAARVGVLIERACAKIMPIVVEGGYEFTY